MAGTQTPPYGSGLNQDISSRGSMPYPEVLPEDPSFCILFFLMTLHFWILVIGFSVVIMLFTFCPVSIIPCFFKHIVCTHLNLAICRCFNLCIPGLLIWSFHQNHIPGTVHQITAVHCDLMLIMHVPSLLWSLREQSACFAVACLEFPRMYVPACLLTLDPWMLKC